MSIDQIETKIWFLIMYDEKLQEEKVGYIKDAIIDIAEKIKEARNKCKEQ